jgi:hypothetical protein
MTLINDDPSDATYTAEPSLPRRAQFFTSWDDPMPDPSEIGGKLVGMHPTMEGRSSDVESVWYDFGTVENPGRVFIVKYGPGYVNAAHSHDTDYCSIVVEGSIEIARKTFGRGAIRFVKAETTYGPIVVGPEGATVIEFFPGPAGGTSAAPADDAGDYPQPYDFFTPAARRVFASPWVNGSGTPGEGQGDS